MMINSIYTHKEIFLRELISNASDAIDKLYFRSLTDTSVNLTRSDYAIFLNINKENRTLKISDNGCGMTAEELEASCRTYVALQTKDMSRTKMLLGYKYSRVEEDESGYIRVYDITTPEEIVSYLYKEGVVVSELSTDKIGLEEYYIDLMKEARK